MAVGELRVMAGSGRSSVLGQLMVLSTSNNPQSYVIYD
jgi:hypothetical protein